MAIPFADCVKETTTTTGTGTVDLAGAATGYLGFVATVGDAAEVYYRIDDAGGNWEIGIGTVTDAATDTLSRDTVLQNNSGTTAAITLTTGTHDVLLVSPAIHQTITDYYARHHLQGGLVKYDATQGYIIEAGSCVIDKDLWTWSDTNGGGPSGYTASKIYYVYAYDNSGTVAFEAVVTAPVWHTDGYWTKTAATTRRLLGAFLTDSGGVILYFDAYRRDKTLSLFWRDTNANATIFNNTTAASWTQLTNLANYVPDAAFAWLLDVEMTFTADGDAVRVGLNPDEISGGDVEDGQFRIARTASKASDVLEDSAIRIRCTASAPDAWIMLDQQTGTPTVKLMVSGVEIEL